MLKFIVFVVTSTVASLNAYAASDCSMLNFAEANMIKTRVNLYTEILAKNNTLQEARNVTIWHRETQKITTLKMATEDLKPNQLDALSRSGCQPWQGAAFSMNMNASITGSALKIFSESQSKEEAYEKLARLSAVKKLSLIPLDLKATD